MAVSPAADQDSPIDWTDMMDDVALAQERSRQAFQIEHRKRVECAEAINERARRAKPFDFTQWIAMDECPSPTYRTMPGYSRRYEIMRPARLRTKEGLGYPHPGRVQEQYPSPPGSPPANSATPAIQPPATPATSGTSAGSTTSSTVPVVSTRNNGPTSDAAPLSNPFPPEAPREATANEANNSFYGASSEKLDIPDCTAVPRTSKEYEESLNESRKRILYFMKAQKKTLRQAHRLRTKMGLEDMKPKETNTHGPLQGETSPMAQPLASRKRKRASEEPQPGKTSVEQQSVDSKPEKKRKMNRVKKPTYWSTKHRTAEDERYAQSRLGRLALRVAFIPQFSIMIGDALQTASKARSMMTDLKTGTIDLGSDDDSEQEEPYDSEAPPADDSKR